MRGGKRPMGPEALAIKHIARPGVAHKHPRRGASRGVGALRGGESHYSRVAVAYPERVIGRRADLNLFRLSSPFILPPSSFIFHSSSSPHTTSGFQSS